jgi:hypothetical protein
MMITMNDNRVPVGAVWVGLLALALAVGACAPDVPQDEDIERSQVVFSPADSRIPLPSTAALDEDGTLPALEGAGSATAQGDFLAYLDSLHGWLPSTPLTVPVDGPIDTDTLTPDAVLLFEFGEDGAQELEVGSVSLDEDNSQIVITPAEMLEFATDYGYVITQDVRDPEGNPIVAPQELYFALSAQPLVADGEIQNDLLAQAASLEDATQLEGLRQLLQPVINAAVEAGVERYEIAGMSVWHTARDSFAVFDPGAEIVPFPNAFLMEDGTVDLPISDDADEMTAALIEQLNQREGFSVTADGWMPIQGAPIDPATVSTDAIPLAWTEGTNVNLYPEDRYRVEYNEDFHVIEFGPLKRPFVKGTTNAGIVTTDVQSVDGYEIKPTPAFVFLRSQHALFADGESTVAQLTDGEAEQLEDARQAYQRLFLAALTLGYADRSEIALAFAFDTDDATRHQQELNAKAVAMAADDDDLAAAADPTTAEEDPAGFDNVGLIQTQAAFNTRWYIDPDADGGLLDDPVTQQVPLTIALPAEAECGAGPYPIAIIGHGDGGERADAVDVFADALAASPHCLATVAYDLPLHGARTPDGDESGEQYLTANPVGTKNSFMQTVVDLAVLTEVIKAGGLENALDADDTTEWIDTSSIGYTGYSVSALLGTNFLATVPDVSVGALNGAGAKITKILLEGALADVILPELPGDLQPGSFDFFQTINLLQWIVEPSDPWTFSTHAQAEPLDALIYDVSAEEFSAGDSIGANEILVQMATQDEFVPPTATELLAEAIGVSLDDTTFDAEGSFITGDSAEADCAVQQIAVWLASGLADGAELGTDEQDACGL